jgi:hypothetical protein
MDHPALVKAKAEKEYPDIEMKEEEAKGTGNTSTRCTTATESILMAADATSTVGSAAGVPLDPYEELPPSLQCVYVRGALPFPSLYGAQPRGWQTMAPAISTSPVLVRLPPTRHSNLN